MKHVAILFCGFCLGVLGCVTRTPLNESQEFLGAIEKDSSDFSFGLCYWDKTGVRKGLLLSTVPPKEFEVREGLTMINGEQAIRITEYFVENGLIEKIDKLGGRQAPLGWRVSLGSRPTMSFHWFLGSEIGDLTKREDILGVTSVLTGTAKAAWDRFIAEQVSAAPPQSPPAPVDKAK